MNTLSTIVHSFFLFNYSFSFLMYRIFLRQCILARCFIIKRNLIRLANFDSPVAFVVTKWRVIIQTRQSRFLIFIQRSLNNFGQISTLLKLFESSWNICRNLETIVCETTVIERAMPQSNIRKYTLSFRVSIIPTLTGAKCMCYLEHSRAATTFQVVI